MANPWRKALSSFLSIVLVAGLLPCASFYGSAWANDAEGEGSAVEAAQVEEGASTADSALAADAAQASESTRLAAVPQLTDSTQLATAAQPTTDAVAIFNRDPAVRKHHLRGRRGSFSCYHPEWGALDLGPQLGISTRIFVGR